MTAKEVERVDLLIKARIMEVFMQEEPNKQFTEAAERLKAELMDVEV